MRIKAEAGLCTNTIIASDALGFHRAIVSFLFVLALSREELKFIPEASAPDERGQNETRIRVSIPTGTPPPPPFPLTKAQSE